MIFQIYHPVLHQTVHFRRTNPVFHGDTFKTFTSQSKPQIFRNRQEIKHQRLRDRQAEETAWAADQMHLPSLSSSQLYHGSRGGGGGGARRSQNPRQESVFLVHRGSDAVCAGRGPHSPGPARRALQKTRQWFTERPSRALAFIPVTKSAAAWGREGEREHVSSVFRLNRQDSRSNTRTHSSGQTHSCGKQSTVLLNQLDFIILKYTIFIMQRKHEFKCPCYAFPPF